MVIDNNFLIFRVNFFTAPKMYKLDIPLDKKEGAAIARRQKNEEERKERIFDARTRLVFEIWR